MENNTHFRLPTGNSYFPTFSEGFSLPVAPSSPPPQSATPSPSHENQNSLTSNRANTLALLNVLPIPSRISAFTRVGSLSKAIHAIPVSQDHPASSTKESVVPSLEWKMEEMTALGDLMQSEEDSTQENKSAGIKIQYKLKKFEDFKTNPSRAGRKLVHHLKVNAERRFYCSYCVIDFKVRSTLVRHIRQKHPGKAIQN